MINTKIEVMIKKAEELKSAIQNDIEDVTHAEHEKLLNRNEKKLKLMEEISEDHIELNTLISDEINNGVDIDMYRNKVNELEVILRELYDLNGKLASIVLPIKQMYKDIIDDITLQNGGSLIEVKA